MIEAKEILAALKGEYDSGRTYQQIARSHGISYTYLHNILSGKRAVDGLTVKKLNRLFPEAKLCLGGRTIGDHNTISNSLVQSDNNFLPGLNPARYRRELIDAVIDLDIDDAARVKVLRAIKNIILCEDD